MEQVNFELKCNLAPLEKEYGGQDVCESNYDSNECNEFLLKKEIIERNCLEEETEGEEVTFSLYPTLNDPNFNLKIAEKQEFHENSIEGDLQEKVEKYANELLQRRYEISPQQGFIKNFLSAETPYNSALLFHGTGTGKTGSALGVAEENRKSNHGKNIIVASSIILTNFQSQLYDENKLKEEGGVWTFESFLGNDLMQEINPQNQLGLEKSYILARLKQIMEEYYMFLTYDELYYKIVNSKNLNADFGEKLIIIDEVHNIRKYDNNRYQNLAKELEKMAKEVEHLRFLFLSATPVFHSVREIVWLLNLLNAADKRGLIKDSQVFNEKGNFVEGGEELLLQKATGYVSFVKGENPYTFPYRLYPKWFSPENTFQRNQESGEFIYHTYPTKEIGGQTIQDLEGYIKNNSDVLFLSTLKKDSIQSQAYKFLLSSQNLNNLQYPLQSLTISYPSFSQTPTAEELTGKGGLLRMMNLVDNKESSVKGAFEYKPETLEKFGRIFSLEEIGKYSAKMDVILKKIQKSTGIILIFSSFLDSSLIPLALALEELGMDRYDQPSLFKNKPKSNGQKYVLITADKRLSPKNKEDIAAATSDENKNGDVIKVVLISKEGSEGVDLKNIRQVHILEPTESYYTLEQVIGRAVRNFSHKDLPFVERNVQIFLYGTLLADDLNEEAADLYFYRRAGVKAIQMGKVTRLLKQTAVDCIVNHGQTNYAQEILQERIHGFVKQKTADGIVISSFPIGDEPFSAVCDFMSTCYYDCEPNKKIEETNDDTYNAQFMFANNGKIIEVLKQLFKREYFYKKDELYRLLGSYAKIEIYAALTQIIKQSIDLIDKFGRPGFLVNHGDYYLYQPKEVSQMQITLEERKNPVMRVPSYVEIMDTIVEKESMQKNGQLVFEELERNYKVAKFSFEKDVEDVGLKDKWYVTYGRVFRIWFPLDVSFFMSLCVRHNIDMLDNESKQALLGFVSGYDEINNSVMEEAKKYFMEQSIITEEGDELFLLFEKGEIQILKLNPETFVWEDSLLNPTEVKEIESRFQIKYGFLVGCIVEEKRKNIFLFKAVHMKSAKKTASCILEKPSKTIEKLQSIQVSVPPNQNSEELCVALEIALRIRNANKLDNKVWFLSPEQAAISGL